MAMTNTEQLQENAKNISQQLEYTTTACLQRTDAYSADNTKAMSANNSLCCTAFLLVITTWLDPDVCKVEHSTHMTSLSRPIKPEPL